jgi:hypothetical protein
MGHPAPMLTDDLDVSNLERRVRHVHLMLRDAMGVPLCQLEARSYEDLGARVMGKSGPL